MKTVPEMLQEAAAIYEERSNLYGDNYKNFGKIMVGLFPNGFESKTIEDWNRLGIFIQIASKLTRYAVRLRSGGHDDSLLDLSVYANMLRELDFEIASRPRKVLSVQDQADKMVDKIHQMQEAVKRFLNATHLEAPAARDALLKVMNGDAE